MRRRNKTGGKEGKTQRPKTLKRRNRPSSVAPDEVTDVARLTRERDEALARETATSEVLQVISSSPGKLEPVFEAMLANAVRICEAKFGTLYRTEGDSLRCVAMHGVPKAYAEERRRVPVIRPAPTTTLARALATKRPVQIADVRNEPLYPDAPSGYTGGTLAKLAGARTLLAVPMLTDVELVGAIIIYRQEVRPFTDKQIELVQNFAAQAVIAIENTRLLSELRQRTDDLSESLEQQTATSEVLKVISSSPGVLEPVFNAMLENAVRICSAKFGILFLSEGDAFRTVALHGAPPAYAEARRREPVVRPRTGTALTRASMLKQPVQIADVKAEPAYHSDPSRSGFLDLAGARTVVAVPMLKEGEVVGAVLIYRQEVRPFTDKQIDLLTNFAAQAVIAIENTRLLSELRESLQQQTATADVLKVISRSTFDLEAVLDTLLESATRLCEGHISWIFRRDGEILRWAASYGHTTEVHAKIKDYFRPLEVPVDRGSVVGRAASEAAVIHIPDVLADPEYKWGEAQKIGGYRASLGAPLLREGNVVGVLFVAKTVPQPFTDKQIELVKTFADQAVIAIENTRLLNELRESLLQQTATSDVLKVISSSLNDLKPVFETIGQRAEKLCDAEISTISMADGDQIRLVSINGVTEEAVEAVRRVWPMRRDAETVTARTIRSASICHVPDVLADTSYQAKDVARVSGYRGSLGVPMIRDGQVIGAIFVARRQPGLFTDAQVQLLETFADQAVIAIENVRLFNETKEALAKQTATADVLKVISRSTFDLEKVLNTLTTSAARLCQAEKGAIFQKEGDMYRLAAHFGFSPEEEQQAKQLTHQHPLGPGRGSLVGRVALNGRVVHINDVLADPEYQANVYQKAFGFRTNLGVPLLREGTVIGVFALMRTEVSSFNEKEIDLVASFADQAVIAIENARLLNELRESLEQQTATSEVLKVISSSPGKLEPVFQTMLENATRICGAGFGTMFHFDGKLFDFAANYGTPPALVELQKRRGPFLPEPGGVLERVLLTKKVAHSADYAVEQPQSPPVALGGARSTVAVPMLKDNELVGGIVIYRKEVRPFSAKEVDLVKNFAAQAVIAIENTRLLNELQESLQQQTATSDVLKVISRSTFDLQAVLDTLVASAARLCEAEMASINREKDAAFQQVASYGYSSEFQAYMRDHPIPAGRGSIVGRTVMQGKMIHILDVLADPEYKMTEAAKIDGIRTMLGVPLLREGTPIGVIALQRKTVRPFTDKQIELVETFADQAVIAIENVRLFNSVEARTRELAASLEDLRTTQDRLVQTQKLASLGQLTAGIAHEIKNPLNFVNNFSAVSVELIDELRQALSGAHLDSKLRAEISEIADTLQGNLDKVVQHGKRADAIVKNMLLHSREGSGEHRPVDINTLVEESLNLAYHGARAEKQGFNITLERSFDPAAGQADVFPQDVTRALLNLISNGFYAATKRKAQADGDRYEPILAAGTRSLGDQVEIRIRDNGTGIPPEVKEKVFNPFFTTKPAGEGTGLGLSISHDIIVKQHGGSIEVDTQPGEFTEIRIILPRAGVFAQ